MFLAHITGAIFSGEIMRTFRFLSAAASALVLGSLAGPALAQDSARIDRLEQRVDGMDAKLNAILQMLTEAKSPSGGAHSDGQSVAATAAAENEPTFQSGLVLDLYTVTEGDDLSSPPSYPAASSPVEAPKVFEWGAFMSVEEMTRFSAPMDKQVAEQWSGLIRIVGSGAHVFQVEGRSDGSTHARACYAHLLIDGKKVVRLDWLNGYTSVNSGQVSLAEGLHDFSFSVTCPRSSSLAEPEYSNNHFYILDKSPTDRAPKPIDPSNFFVKS